MMKGLTMSYAVTINRSGQATIPKAIREVLKVGIGDKIRFEPAKGGVLLKRAQTDEEFFAEIDALKSEKTKDLIKEYRGKSVAELKRLPKVVEKYKGEYL